MTDLERVELAIWRLHAKRQQAFESGGASSLDMGAQKLLEELARELAAVSRDERREKIAAEMACAE